MISPDKLNKYSKKCLELVEVNNINHVFINDDIIKQPFIKKLYETINNTTTYDCQYDKVTIKKTHQKKYPLIYLIYKRLYEMNQLKAFLRTFQTTDCEFIDLLVSNVIDFTNFFFIFSQNQYKLSSLQKHYFKDYLNDGLMLEYFKQLYECPENKCKLHDLLYNNPFMSLDIQMYGESNDLVLCHCKTNNINLMFYCKKEYTDNEIKKIINKIITIAQIVSKMANSTTMINIVILYSPIKKYIWNNYNNICPINSNSGSSIKYNIINIWRKEELCKVLFHELIHYFNLDQYNTFIDSNLDNYIYLKINVNGKINSCEAFTEFLAIIYHTTFILYQSNISINRFNQLINKEIAFSLIQIKKILDHYFYKDLIDLQNNNIILNQTTSVFSYYILKCFLLLNMEKMLENDDKINQIKDIFDSMFSNKIVNDIISGIIVNGTYFMQRTLRMSCIELV